MVDGSELTHSIYRSRIRTSGRGSWECAAGRGSDLEKGKIMSVRRNPKLAVLGVAVLAPLVLTGAAQADDDPTHTGNPRGWGPPLAALCANPDDAVAAGYNLILGDDLPNVLVGGPGADAIFAYGDNDTVWGGPGPDLLCLGKGNDMGNGGAGNDAIFGEWGNDQLLGVAGRDFLHGGPQFDQCNGGTQADAAVACEVVVNVP
jgi:hypothetical protein